ncbi:hypothetical protein BKA70DRAFT_1491731 [Coprinopsis sp. MPI-PUGE-AT-0042]|nr:hypothetical protein BKA70DRAFT_1491731 [Coprinopsis sp. MPI-PUGE-AT-0042]
MFEPNSNDSSSFNGDAYNLQALEDYVKSSQFDEVCGRKALGSAYSPPIRRYQEDEGGFWSVDISASDCCTTTDESLPYKLSPYEAHLYYAGLGPKGGGPKLIYRTSNDKFAEPTGPEAYTRLMRLVAVPDHHPLGQDNRWEKVRDKVVELLDESDIKVSSIEFVRFTWLDESTDWEEDYSNEWLVEAEGELNYDDIPLIQPAEYEKRHYTNPTIWIGVSPDTLTASHAHEASRGIFSILDSFHIKDIDIAYRESVYKEMSGHEPALFRPVEDDDPLKDIIQNVSVFLSLPITGCHASTNHTLGPLFRVGDRPSPPVTASLGLTHLINPTKSVTPRREVFLMSPSAFAEYLNSIQAAIGKRYNSVETLEGRIRSLSGRAEDGIEIRRTEIELELSKIRREIGGLKRFYIDIEHRWSQPKDRAIGFVCWSPPIGVGDAPNRYTNDFCVIELYKDKFRNMIGNVLNLGPEKDIWAFKELMNDRTGFPSKFEYPYDGLLSLRGILTADQITKPDTSNIPVDHIRRVIKRGSRSHTTVGTLTRYLAFVRKYSLLGHVDSLEVPILSHERETGTFARGGDSGSVIVSPNGELVALLTGGAVNSNGRGGADISFATPFEWIWDLVKERFPGANLDFGNLQEFLADVA